MPESEIVRPKLKLEISFDNNYITVRLLYINPRLTSSIDYVAYYEYLDLDTSISWVVFSSDSGNFSIHPMYNTIIIPKKIKEECTYDRIKLIGYKQQYEFLKGMFKTLSHWTSVNTHINQGIKPKVLLQDKQWIVY